MCSRILNISSLIFLLSLMISCSSGRHVIPSDYTPVKSEYKEKGILETVICKSSQPGLSERRMLVYLPANYYNTDESFPVLYLLHGARGTETSWIEEGHFTRNLDSLTAIGKAKPMIVVMPNTSQYNNDADYAKSRRKYLSESFFEINGTVEKNFIGDVVGTVDSLFRTHKCKEGRAIAGLSIGALQAMFLSATYPQMFDYVGLFSPMTKPATCFGPDSDFYDGLKKKLPVQFANPPKVYCMMTGVWDIFYALMQHIKFYFDTHDFPYDFYLSPGGHTWKNWERYSVMFLERIW